MAEDLFENAAAERMRKEAPLARRIAPRMLDELVGQEHILGPGKILRRMIEADRITSLVIFGPPGCAGYQTARRLDYTVRESGKRTTITTGGKS